MSGADFYGITSPQFPSETVTVGDYGGRQGGTLRIAAPGTSDADRYITGARLDGKPLRHSWVSQHAIAHGATLGYAISDTPGDWGTKPQDAPPSIDRNARNDIHQLGGGLSPEQALVVPSADQGVQQRLTMNLVATDPGTADVRLHASAPGGVAIAPADAKTTIASDGLPTTGSVDFTVAVPAGTPEGEYPVTVTARMPHAAPITRTATIVVRSGHCAGATAQFCPVDLGRDLNHDGVATLAAPGEGNFDGGGWSYAANLMPAPGPVTLGGVPYQAPSTAGSDPNFVEAHGQSIVLPAGGYAAAHILGAAHHGSADDTATVTYADGSTQDVPLRLGDWAGSPAFGNTDEIQMPYRLKAGQGQDSPPVAIFGTVIPLDASRPVRSITLPNDSHVEVYAVTLAKG
jgi:Glycosyl hydrolase family 92